MSGLRCFSVVMIGIFVCGLGFADLRLPRFESLVWAVEDDAGQPETPADDPQIESAEEAPPSAGSGEYWVINSIDIDKDGIADVLVYDTDGDGVGDYVEGDTDGDGAPDVSSTDSRYIGNIDNEFDPSKADSDSDGLTDSEEYEAETDAFTPEEEPPAAEEPPESEPSWEPEVDE